MKRIIILTFILIIASSVSACETLSNALRPASWILDMYPKNASPMYKKAWVEGCESGLASMSNDYYKTFYTFKQDQSLLHDDTYYKVWKDTFTFCRHYQYGLIREANVRMHTPDADLKGGMYYGLPNTVGFTGSLDSTFGRKAQSESIFGPDSGKMFYQEQDTFFSPPSSAGGGFFGNPGASSFLP